jgi:exopolyphosphatase/guanosine-5'-triphosphate,3'-diphosphate pyrophosphatase
MASTEASAETAIVPRWEWRTFGDRFDVAEDELGALAPDRIEESDETYLLSLDGTDTVKVRGGLLDIKHLEEVSAEGLERWMPVMKAAFPLAAADVGATLTALGVAVASPPGDVPTVEELLAELVEPNPRLLAIGVRKRRGRFTLEESPDLELVVATVRRLGLEGRPNVSYPRALKALAGFGAPRRAVIDVGTNSVKFCIGERGEDGGWRTIVDRSEVTRLGEGLRETGRLSPEPADRTIEAIAAMADEARRTDAPDITAVGTAGLRIASNTTGFLDEVASRCGVRIEVISGEQESRLAYLAVKAGIGQTEGSLVVFDTGGGSSQFTFGHAEVVEERWSVNVGAVGFSERFGLDQVVSGDVLASTFDAIAADLERLDGRPTPDSLVAIGGAVTNLAAVKHELGTYDADVVRGTVLDRAEIDRQIELYRSRTADERRQIVGLQPKRAEVILAGACIVRTVLTKLGSDSLTVSDRGLRHGLLIDGVGGELT